MKDPLESALLAQRTQIRHTEKSLRRLNKELGMRENLFEELKRKLPQYMLPGNVGALEKVTWPFWYQIEVDFGTNPTYGPNSKLTGSFQVSQEAAFMIGAISRKTFSYSESGELAPLQVEFRDRQSSRVLNDAPVTLQTIGKKSRPTILPTPFLLMPAAYFEAQFTSWLPADQVTVGSGKIQLSFFGYRVRAEDFAQVYSTIYGMNAK